MIRVGLSPDLLTSAGTPTFGTGPLALLDDCPGIAWEVLAPPVAAIDADIAARYDALYVNTPTVGADSVARGDRRLKLVARHGVGYDTVDVTAMTRAGVLVTNTPAAVRRPVATMAITFVLALAQRLMTKQALTRHGEWHRRADFMGQGLSGKTLGVVGAGGIGREILRLAAAFDMRLVVSGPRTDPQSLAPLGASLLPLEELLAQSDFVVLACRLDDSTRHLLNASRLALMKPSAYLVNVARGGVIDEVALINALKCNAIAGAALDVFEQEPVAPENPLLTMDQVIVTPHSLCWTDECFDAIARDGLASIVDFTQHRRPSSIVNTEVLGHPAVAAWFTGDTHATTSHNWRQHA